MVFETSNTLFTFVLLGRVPELRAKNKTGDALTTLMNLQASTAVLLELDGSGKPTGEREIDAELLQPNDTVKIVRGGKVPADGVVVFGNSSVDQSTITGESMPVPKTTGDAVIAGTVNQEGRVHVRSMLLR